MTDLLSNKQVLITAIEAALEGDWETSHNIVQVYNDPIANWIHAVLHKIEGDESNSKYWYARTNINGKVKSFDTYGDGFTELVEIADNLHYPDEA
jgi:hypothetical protein